MAQKTLEDAELQQLVREAQEGDTDAFGKVYDHYFTAVYRYTAFRVAKEVAEDLVADIFVKAWEKLHTYKPQKNVPFSSWLFRIARYSVIDTYRSQRQWEEVPEELSDPDELNRADTATIRRYKLKAVRKAMDQLPKRHREVLTLSYMADLPHSEIAKVLRMTEGAVRILKFRALKKLEKALPADIQEGGVLQPTYGVHSA